MKRATIPKDPSRADVERFGSVPRDVRLTANGWTVAVFALAFAVAALAAALGLPILRGNQLAARDRAEREAVWTDATITRVHVEKGEHARPSVTFRYTAPDGAHEGTVRLSEDDDRDIAVGGRLRIAYLRSQPSKNWIAGGKPRVLPLWLLPLIPLALLAAAGALALAVRRERVLLSEGRFAIARVISSTKVGGSHGPSYRVRYEFKTLSGATVTAAASRSRPLAEGATTVAVVYHRENARWNAVYPLSMSRIGTS